MNKIAVAAALIAALALSLPQTAGAKTGQKQYRPKPERLSIYDKTQKGEAESCGDPYWDCCLSYYRGWGPGACGR